MLVIAAIDLKGGQCVRLTQGDMNNVTVFADDPVEMAKRWEAEGARLIHVVDLDGAIEGSAKNFEAVKRIVESVNVPVQIGGGIRNLEVAEKYLALAGLKQVILGTAAIKDPDFLVELIKRHPRRVAVGIDAKDGLVAIKGWVEVTDMKAVDLARRLEGVGVACIIYTDIARDGMMKGPNVEATAELADSVTIPVIASGGISSISDVERYRKTAVEGVLIGRALYTGDIDLAEAIRVADAL